jgi:hypothetical protein
LEFIGQSPPCLKGGAPQGRGDIKPKYYDIPQSNCLKSAICQPPLGKGAKAAFGGKLLDKLKFDKLWSFAGHGKGHKLSVQKSAK